MLTIKSYQLVYTPVCFMLVSNKYWGNGSSRSHFHFYFFYTFVEGTFIISLILKLVKFNIVFFIT